MHKRVIFLDLDGVLVGGDTFLLNQAREQPSFDPEPVALFRDVVERSGAVIVISSMWRKSDAWRETIGNCFNKTGWENPPIIDRTPELTGPRGAEIKDWLENHPTENFVILDDTPDMLAEQLLHFVQCNFETGLMPHEAEAVMRIFNEPLT
ncbi:MAG: HAD domain-containing protein [bacterium]|nr:HAD domain-containing protein [bacterium]